jgi:hypothetical protein
MARRLLVPEGDCAWCGAELAESPDACANGRGEGFCRPGHRSASGRALRRLLERDQEVTKPGTR